MTQIFYGDWCFRLNPADRVPGLLSCAAYPIRARAYWFCSELEQMIHRSRRSVDSIVKLLRANIHMVARLVPIIVVLILSCIIDDQSHDYILNNHNKLMWFITLANMMVLIHVIYNHQLSFYFYGANDGVGPMLGHRVALNSNIGRAAATLATNKGVEILAAAIDSSLTGGVATSSIHSLRLLLDTGASIHVVGDRNILQGYKDLAKPRIGRVADGNNVSMTGVGTIQTEQFTITNVYYIEGFPMNLISVSQLYRQYGMGASFIRGTCEVYLADGTIAGVGVVENDGRGVFVLTNLHVPAGPVQE